MPQPHPLLIPLVANPGATERFSCISGMDAAKRQTIFTDDLVIKDGQLGVVERAPNSSDMDSEGDEDDIIDDERKLPPGSAAVHWKTQDMVTTEYTSNLQLADRVFLLGDIVTRGSDQLGQTGIVVGMRMFSDLRCADSHVLKAVDSKLLQPIAACRPGTLVVHEQAHWLGRVDEVYDNVQLSFDDGNSCKANLRVSLRLPLPPPTHTPSLPHLPAQVVRTDANSLSVHSPTMDEQTWFWPSMRVRARP